MSPPDSTLELGTRGSAVAWNEKAHALAVQVQKARTQRRMTPWTLAESCGLAVSTVQEIENARPVAQHAVDTVCRTLGLPSPKLDDDPVHTFALLIRQRREQAHLKQYQLAVLSGLHPKTIKEIERAARWPMPDTCIALISVRALHLQPEDIAAFVTDLDQASDLAKGLRELAEVRITKNPKLLTRTRGRESDEDDKDDKDDKEEPQNDPTKAPDPTKPRPPLLFTLRVYVDGSIIFTPSIKARRE